MGQCSKQALHTHASRPRAGYNSGMAGQRPRSLRFSYYDRLSASEKRTYRRSDGIAAVSLPHAASLAGTVEQLRIELLAGKRARIEQVARELCLGITLRLGVPPLLVKVRSVRPSELGGELHGLYTWEEGKVPVIEVWMRTARNRRIVQFRTFLRTLLHEVCHHLDFTLLELADTFHTAGFFRRESSLVKQLAGASRKRPTKASTERPEEPKAPGQLGLFS